MTDYVNDNLRFSFGKNWKNFSRYVNEKRIQQAKHSLQNMLSTPSLKGQSFIDVGCGSGLFSLAAIRLGAQKVRSFDFDKHCVDCAQFLQQQFAHNSNWLITQGDILDDHWIDSIGRYDIVYSWGVLHHTGAMWQAFDNVRTLVAPGGTLFISIYNDQGLFSKIWREIKILYNRMDSNTLRWLLVAAFHCTVVANRTISGIIKRIPIKEWYIGSPRGMSLWHDSIDWIGGYPFETGSPSQIISFFQNRGFRLLHVRKTNGAGCNEFVFKKLQ